MGIDQSKEKLQGESGSNVSQKKSKAHSNIHHYSSGKKTEKLSGDNSIDSEDNSDNESFSLIVKHKTHGSNIKKGLVNQNVNIVKNSSDLDWDSIVKIIDTDVNQGLVIIEDSN